LPDLAVRLLVSTRSRPYPRVLEGLPVSH